MGLRQEFQVILGYVLLSLCNGAAASVLTDDGNDTLLDSNSSLKTVNNTERFPYVVVDFVRVENPFIISLWIFCACLGKIGFHMTPRLAKVFPESCMLIVLGVVIGLLLFYTHAATVSPLTADVFFIYMLPPIILDAGYFMPNRLFFDHLGTILMFAVVGTIWNALTIGISLYALGLTGLFGEHIPVLHMLLFSSLISAVDPVAVIAVFEEIHVEEVLFILVFGESLLNDGITVVLYHMFEGFSHLGQDMLIMQDYIAATISFLLVALGGTAIGIIWGFLAAFVTRFTKDVSVIEPVFIFVMSYLAYLTAEIFHFSGILAITFCGIAMKNYTTQNMSKESQITVKYAMKMMAQSSETIIFMFLGVSTVHDEHKWDTAFVLLTIAFCTVYRFIGTLMISAVCNHFRVQKISSVQQFVLAYGGLRGAVAFALVLTIDPTIIPAQPMFVTTTIAVVYFTVFFQGITIKPLVQLLGIKKSSNRKLTMNERLHERSMDYIMAGVEDIIGVLGNYYSRDKFKHFNNKYITPLLVRDSLWSEPKLLETLKNIKMDEAMSYMHNNGHPPEQIESFAALYRTAQNSHGISNKEEGGESWNLDVGELQYNSTAKDINEANFHHLLSDEYIIIKQRKHGGTYKRHAVRDEEVNGKTSHRTMNMRLHGNNNRRKFNKKVPSKAVDVPVHVKQINGSEIKLQQDQIEKQMRSNPAFQPDETDPASYDGIAPKNYKRVSVKGPVVAETTLPWRRHAFAENATKASIVQRKQSVDANNDHVPTMAEMLLPWKREDNNEEHVRQAEQPSWSNNQDYIQTDSPSNTYLRKIGDNVKPSIYDIFKKRANSSASLYSIDEKPKDDRRKSCKGTDPRKSSAKDEAYWTSAVSDGARRGMTMSDFRSDPNGRHGPAFNKESPSHGASLLNTAITEEDRKGGNSPTSPTKEDHVINMGHMQPKPQGDETKF